MQQEKGESVKKNEVLKRNVPSFEPSEYTMSDAVPVHFLGWIANLAGIPPKCARLQETKYQLKNFAWKHQ